jgi:hypothetical protein
MVTRKVVTKELMVEAVRLVKDQEYRWLNPVGIWTCKTRYCVSGSKIRQVTQRTLFRVVAFKSPIQPKSQR